jgi:hypothetical protein
MEKKPSILDRAATVVVAAAFFLIGFFLLMLGVTFLPVIGILTALPIMWLALRFLSPAVTISRAYEQAAVVVYAEHEAWCPWPPVCGDNAAADAAT